MNCNASRRHSFHEALKCAVVKRRDLYLRALRIKAILFAIKRKRSSVQNKAFFD